MSEYDDFLSDFYTQFYNAGGWYGGAETDLNNAESSYGTGDDHAALGSLILAVRHIVDSLTFLYDPYDYDYPRYNVVKLFDLIGVFMADYDPPTPYELTMSDILNTMLKAESSDIKYFVGLTDAYRQSVWDKPYNAEFYAALARGFEQWG